LLLDFTSVPMLLAMQVFGVEGPVELLRRNDRFPPSARLLV